MILWCLRQSTPAPILEPTRCNQLWSYGYSQFRQAANFWEHVAYNSGHILWWWLSASYVHTYNLTWQWEFPSSRGFSIVSPLNLLILHCHICRTEGMPATTQVCSWCLPMWRGDWSWTAPWRWRADVSSAGSLAFEGFDMASPGVREC